MNTKAKSTNKFTYSALKYSQRGGTSGAPPFVIFHAPAGEILKWADVERLTPKTPTGAQRPLKDLKVRKVSKFVRADDLNTIPTSIIVALDPSSVSFKSLGDDKLGQLGTVTINVRSKHPGLIIDGQHRVHGVAEVSPSMHLNIVAFLEDDDSERAFQFVVINNTASRISRDHIQALNLHFDKEQLNGRLITSSGVGLGISDRKYDDLQVIDRSEPFSRMLNYPTNGSGFIPPSAIESALQETYNRGALLGIEGDELEMFLSIWTAIRELRPNAWRPDSKLLHKVSIHVITVYLLESMISRQRNTDDLVDFTSVAVLEDQVRRVIGRIPEQFWTMEWKAKELDTSLGRKVLMEALGVIDSNARFNRIWYENVAFIDANLVVKEAASSKSTGGRKKAAKAVKKGAGSAVKSTKAKKAAKSRGGKAVSKSTGSASGVKARAAKRGAGARS